MVSDTLLEARFGIGTMHSHNTRSANCGLLWRSRWPCLTQHLNIPFRWHCLDITVIGSKSHIGCIPTLVYHNTPELIPLTTPSAGGLVLQSCITLTQRPVLLVGGLTNKQLIQLTLDVQLVSYVVGSFIALNLRPTTTSHKACSGVGYIHILNLRPTITYWKTCRGVGCIHNLSFEAYN